VNVPGHLFRREAGRLVAAVTRLFGIHNLSLAEDVVQDALCSALQVWKFHGVPQDPEAWLLTAAKNRALDVLRRERTARTFAPELSRLVDSEWTLRPTVDELLHPLAIKDDQLRMIFSCCHPRLPEEAQVALVLNILCGFGAGEIAAAFLTGRAAIEKRTARAKKVLAGSSKLFELTNADDFAQRLAAVQRAIYLLFNEGYHGSSAVRAELCEEAMRLASLLEGHALARTPSTLALCALFCLHAARLPARVDAAGNLSSLIDQDRSRWNAKLTAEGLRLLDESATGHEASPYHLEAAIAAVHAKARTAEETQWSEIVDLYDLLLRLNPSPVIALNRAIAVGQSEGPSRGLAELHAIQDRERLAFYPFYPAAIAELALRSGNAAKAREQFGLALNLARNPSERRFFRERLEAAGQAWLAPSSSSS
jgi:RNA polymerase sigma factor (sigma-70 family)